MNMKAPPSGGNLSRQSEYQIWNAYLRSFQRWLARQNFEMDHVTRTASTFIVSRVINTEYGQPDYKIWRLFHVLKNMKEDSKPKTEVIWSG